MASRCEQTRDKLSAWLDGELGAPARRAVAVHLDTCAACRRELALLASLEDALGRLPAPAPPQVAQGVLARLARPRRRWWQNVAIAASLLMGLTLGGSLARDMYLLYPGGNGSGGEILALEDFNDFPQGSLGTVLVSYGEEGNGS